MLCIDGLAHLDWTYKKAYPGSVLAFLCNTAIENDSIKTTSNCTSPIFWGSHEFLVPVPIFGSWFLRLAFIAFVRNCLEKKVEDQINILLNEYYNIATNEL